MKIAVLGGGVAGLTAAHELVERGFDVEVIEARPSFGGKARSIEIPGTNSGSRRPLPGEHGFRFFPGFYRHVPETMSRIPRPGGGTVADNLVPATQMLLARHRADEVVLPSEPPETLAEVQTFLGAATGTIGITAREAVIFWAKALKFVSAGDARRFGQYEYESWWNYIDAGKHSEPYRRFLAEGATRSLVAMRADVSSTRTIGTIYFQMLRDLIDPTVDVDRLLNGPTNEVWIDPWIDYLTVRGVVFRTGARVRSIELSGQRVSSATLETNEAVDADFFVLALPVEVVVDLVGPDLENAAPALGRLRHLQTAWMNGIQFYLDRDVKISHGHGLYLDSPWALTSISQGQFWDRDLSIYGDGMVKGILSVVISEWDAPGLLHKKTAKECTREEIREEVWHQLEYHLSDDGVDELGEANVVAWFLDDSIVQPNPMETVNLEPLLINTIGSWDDRPECDVGLSNMFIASDYVRTYTDLATMESANEAARRAVNEIVKRTGIGQPCDVWPLREWAILNPIRALDDALYARGMPHPFDIVGRVFGV